MGNTAELYDGGQVTPSCSVWLNESDTAACGLRSRGTRQPIVAVAHNHKPSAQELRAVVWVSEGCQFDPPPGCVTVYLSKTPDP